MTKNRENIMKVLKTSLVVLLGLSTPSEALNIQDMHTDITKKYLENLQKNKGFLEEIISLIDRSNTSDGNSIYLSQIITHVDAQRALIKKLNTAKETDKIKLYISGFGGSIHTLKVLVSALQNTKAHVTVILEGDVYSAHAVLALCGDELQVNSFSSFMFHHSSALNDLGRSKGYDRGIPNRDKEDAFMEAHLKDMEDLIKAVGVLTTGDLDRVNKGEDIYIEAEEVKKRFDHAKTEGKTIRTNREG